MTCFRLRSVHVAVVALVSISHVVSAEPAASLEPLPEHVTARVEVFPDEAVRDVSSWFIGTNLHPGKPRERLLDDPEVQRRVRAMGVKTIRFPNGCIADLYNWKSPAPYTITVDAFLEFCEAVGAESYYTLNMQGGTEGLEGPVPPGTALEEVIRYRHPAPNPCGYTNYHFGTLAEALELMRTYTIERALAGKEPILAYEFGNENWGQATTDWPPEVYGKTCEVYARAMREALEEARREHPELEALRLYLVMVSYPSMGNNQDPQQAVNREINVRWTAQVNRLARLGLIDAVQEHFYPWGLNDGNALIWTAHNLHNILALRHGRSNERLGGYVDEALAYELPVEITEWNVKCWGNRPKAGPAMVNAGFEEGLTGWAAASEPENAGVCRSEARAARRGSKGLRLKMSEAGGRVEIRQTLSIGETKAKSLWVTLWVKAIEPESVRVMLRRAGESGEGAVLKEKRPTQTNMWERLILSIQPPEDLEALELVVRLEGANREAWVDEVQTLHWTETANLMPPVADRFEQQLFLVDALRELLLWPTPRTHVHHLIGNYPCGTLQADGSERDNAQAYYLLHDRIGDRVVEARCEVPTFGYHTEGEWASDFNAAVPSCRDIPAMSSLATRRGSQVYLLLVNRTTDRAIEAEIRLNAAEVGKKGELRTLEGVDFDMQGARVATSSIDVANPMRHVVPPHCAQVLTIRLKGGE